MSFPLGLLDLSLWLAITSIILLITSELFSAYYGNINIYVNQKRLQIAAFVISTLFLATVVIRIIDIIILAE